MKKSALWMMLFALCGLALVQNTGAQGMKKDDHPMGDKKMGDMKMGGQKMAMADHKMVQANDVQWGDPPPVFPAGAKFAVLQGDPSKPGLFIVRLKAPNGYRVPPHWHPTAEYVTVISGTFVVGMGDKWDDKAMTEMGAGGYITMNPRARHYAMTKGETVVQVGGMGPFVLNYVDPNDNPMKKMPAKPAAMPMKKK